jgi:hypothetical protein
MGSSRGRRAITGRMSTVQKGGASMIKDPEQTRSRRRGYGTLAGVALSAAMVVVMAVTAFTLHRHSPLGATAPIVNASEPTTDGQGDIVPVRGRSGIER